MSHIAPQRCANCLSWRKRLVSVTRLNRLVIRPSLQGFICGGGCGFVVSLILQSVPRIYLPYGVFSGAPQGLDELVYFSLVQAIWRTGNGFTYAYPFALFWPAPAVLIQLPLALASWIAPFTGLPLAFEILRIGGTAFSAAALWVLVRRLFPHRFWRRWALVACVFGGGWFTFGAVVEAIQTAGIWGLTEWGLYVKRTMGPLYWWLPFLAQNVFYPLEAVYHALVLSGFAALLCGRFRLAVLLHIITWFSNPFPAASLSVPVWLWLVGHIWHRDTFTRQIALRRLAAWTLIIGAGFCYYGPFLGQWPVLAELGRMHRVPLAPPPSLFQIICWFAPFTPFLFWGWFSSKGRGTVWQKPEWQLISILAISQFGFLAQFAVLGLKAIQPYHFNRGYLSMALTLLTMRSAFALTLNPRIVPIWLKVLVVSTCFDQAVFFARELFTTQPSAIVSKEDVTLRDTLSQLPPDQVFISANPYNLPYLAGFTQQIPYDMPTTMVIPWQTERRTILQKIVQHSPNSLIELGVTLAILNSHDQLATTLLHHGWRLVKRVGQYSVLIAPESRPYPPPRRPPPSTR